MNAKKSTQRIAIARNAVHDFVTARAASIPTTTITMTATMAYWPGDCFMDAILDVPLCGVKDTKHLVVDILLTQNVITI